MPKKERATNTESFIRLAKEIHGDKDDYSLTVFTGARNKVVLICVIGGHGEYQQTANNHLRNHRCRKCRDHGNKLRQTLSKEEVIRKCEERHPGLVDYSRIGDYINRRIPVTFVCRVCQTEYKRDIGHMLGKGRGHGCSKCNGGVAGTRDWFITEADIKHDNYYSYDLVDYVNAITKVKIVCPCGNTFEQTPNHHLGGCGCPFCAGRHKTLNDIKKLSDEKFKNNPFNFCKAVLINMKTKITLICPNGHEFRVTPHVHIRKNSLGGCKLCMYAITKLRNSYSQDQWLSLATTKHNGLYLYPKVIYSGSSSKVIITCRKHGDFEQCPVSHLAGSGCRKCGIEYTASLKVYDETDFKELIYRAHRIHGKYEYIHIYRSSELRIKVHCKLHGVFDQRLLHHLNGHGCPSCSTNYSKGQIEWIKFREVTDGPIHHAENGGELKVPGTNIPLDGTLSSNKMYGYQYHGDFWHGNPVRFISSEINPKIGCTYGELYDNTIKQTNLLRSLGYNIIEIWEYDWKCGKKALIELQRSWRSRKYM
jgi:hypothetical protein